MSVPAGAATRSNGCESVHAMLDPDGSKFRQLSIGFDRKSLLELRYRGKADRISEATECVITSPSDYFEVKCSWDFDKEEAAARTKIENLRLDMARCLPAMLNPKANLYSTDSLVVDLEYDLTIDTPDKETIDVSLALHRYMHRGLPSFQVYLTFSR